MIMKCKKQFIALFMAISVIFCVGSESYIKAEALEWAIPTITAGEAIKWLLGLLGVTVAGGALANTDWDNLVEQYNDYAEIKGQTAVDTGKFWEDVINGTLDTGSQAWTTFKEWVSSLSFGAATGEDLVNNLLKYSNLQIDKVNYNNINVSTIKSGCLIVSDNSFRLLLFNTADVNFNYSSRGLQFSNADVISSTIHGLYQGTTLNVSSFVAYNDSDYNAGQISSYNYCYYIDIGNAPALSHFIDISNPFEISFNAYNKDIINDIALTLSSAISDAIPDVIPLPWDQVAGTAEGINEKIDELIDKVNEGVLSLEDYMVAIQAILGVIAFDTTNDLVVPADPDLPDETIQDKINENVNNNGFVLTGLENFFPFCIPFDIYSFITILVSDPVAPVINWHIYNPVTKTDNIMTLDFAMWEPVVILFRYIFDFLFIIGLALIARSLIGGDD